MNKHVAHSVCVCAGLCMQVTK